MDKELNTPEQCQLAADDKIASIITDLLRRYNGDTQLVIAHLLADLIKAVDHQTERIAG